MSEKEEKMETQRTFEPRVFAEAADHHAVHVPLAGRVLRLELLQLAQPELQVSANSVACYCTSTVQYAFCSGLLQ